MKQLLRHWLLLAATFLLPLAARAQSVGIGTATSAALNITSTSQGLLLPRLTAAIASPAPGLQVLQTDGTPGFFYYSGVACVNVTDGRAPDTNGSAMPANQGVVSTLAGSGSYGCADGMGTATSFSYPDGVAVGANGTVYVADHGSHLIRKITSTGVVSTLAGTSSVGSDNGTGTAASFRGPNGVAVDAAGTVYVADRGNHLIRKITPTGVVTTLAGTGSAGSANGTGTAASFNRPTGITVDAAGTVYVADQYNQLIRKITPGGVVTTLAGSVGVLDSIDGTGPAASFHFPSGVAVDAAGTVYVADQRNAMIRKITPAGVVTTLAGTGSPGSADGSGPAASFHEPTGVAVDVAGTVYVADRNNNLIRQITPAGVVSTLAGDGGRGRANGTGTAASFSSPTGVAVDAAGTVYVADSFNHLIRVIK